MVGLNIREEKRFLYESMRSLIEERRELTSEIHTIRKRIDELSKLEETVLKDIDLQTYIQMHQEHEEAKKKALLEKVLPSPKNHSMAEAREMTPLAIKEEAAIIVSQAPRTPEKEYKKEINNIEEKNNKQRSRKDRTPVYNYIKSELSKSVKPVSRRELKKMIERDLNIELKEHHMSDIIKHLMKIDENFKRAATNGYYTYRSL